MRKLFTPSLMVGLSLAIILPLTGVQNAELSGSDDDLFELRKNFEIFGALYEEVVVGYVDEVHAQPFMKSGIDAMLADLDPYTRFYDQADNMDIAQMRAGPQATIGLNIGMEGGRMTVLAPEGLNSGYRQGVQIGDRLLRVGGVDVTEVTVRDVVGLLRGEEYSSVKLTFERDGEPRPVTFQLQREITHPTNVSYAGYLGPDSTRRIGYVRLDGFGQRAAREVGRACRTMLRGGGLNGVVLDLRNNPGGLVSEAVELVGLFVQQGTVVVSIQGRDENRTQRFATEDEPMMPDIPLLVLVNEFSASSSEIVSGALQDLDRAVIVGETTYGKGLVQVGRALPYNSSMRMTIGHYYTPRGRDLQSHRIASRSAQIARPSVENYRTTSGRPVRSGVGIEPDVSIHQAPPGELLQALRQEGAFFRFAGEWVRQNPSAEIDDSIFETFTSWLSEQGFTYTTGAGQALVRARAAVADNWDPAISEAIDQAREAVETQKTLEIQNQRAGITAAVIDEVQSRLLQRDDYIKGQLRVDEMAIKALEIALDVETYRSLLTL